ncbi:S-adenosyl-L-methionine-dependent methyltransferase [Limtongia smithiae]|uniref:S-adenosyl-L-methionine-dependent methyltransferase n=1 Tax=Limtongia smithiae TaxID=1125753 RepID=UPI0034D00946
MMAAKSMPFVSGPNQKSGATIKKNSDRAIQETNNSSIVSKRSVERLYCGTAPQESGKGAAFENGEFFRYFVKKPQRRAPLINRGYWIRMEAVHSVVRQFLGSCPDKRKVIINLGCGFDPLPFQYLSKTSTNRSTTIFVDADYPDLISTKVKTINETSDLCRIISPYALRSQNVSVKLASSSYYAIGCDLSNLPEFEAALESCGLLGEDADILFVAEVSLTYMDTSAADNVISWASRIGRAVTEFALLEQIVPAGADHPFARTMLSHFNRLKTPIKSVCVYPDVDAQKQRFSTRGWANVQCDDLHQFWRKQVTTAEKIRIEAVEHFDEWEEFILFCQHYFLLVASTAATCTEDDRTRITEDTDAPAAKPWAMKTTKTSNLRRRWGAATGIDKSTIAYFGGLNSTTRLDTSLLITRDSTAKAFALLTTSRKPTPRMCHAMVKLRGSDIMITGGRGSPGAPSAECWIYGADSKQWNLAAPMPESRYRHSMSAMSDTQAIVFGGHTDGDGQWLLYDSTHDNGGCWTKLPATSNLGTRLSPSMCWLGDRGIVSGGFDSYGEIYDDAYFWFVESGVNGATIRLERISETPAFARAGACMSKFDDKHVILCGGVGKHRLLQLDEWIQTIDIKSIAVVKVAVKNNVEYPMLIGTSVHVTADHEVVFIGGGAVCFSFGACWNELTAITSGDGEVGDDWRVLEESQESPIALASVQQCDGPANNAVTANDIIIPDVRTPSTPPSSVAEWQAIYDNGLPVLARAQDIGACAELWTPEYLKRNAGADRIVTVHVSSAATMNFQSKNFHYDNMPFSKFIDHVWPCAPPSSSELYYLRALSTTDPKARPANIAEDYPALAKDFAMPTPLADFIGDKVFSSPLRVSSAAVGMWLHYDVTANYLVQIRGSKRIRLYPPSDITRLSIPPGASSSTIADIFNTPVCGTHPIETVMHPGDIIFIPAMWLHATCPLQASVSVNVFWKDLEPSLYAPGRDVYGNRDLKAYEDGRRLVEKIVRGFDRMPEAIRQFYIMRLSEELRRA